MTQHAERRTRTLTDDDIAALSLAIHGATPPDEHAEHHRMFRLWIERENRKAEFREKVKAQVGGWTIITMLSGVGYAAWEGFRATLRIKWGG